MLLPSPSESPTLLRWSPTFHRWRTKKSPAYQETFLEPRRVMLLPLYGPRVKSLHTQIPLVWGSSETECLTAMHFGLDAQRLQNAFLWHKKSHVIFFCPKSPTRRTPRALSLVPTLTIVCHLVGGQTDVTLYPPCPHKQGHLSFSKHCPNIFSGVTRNSQPRQMLHSCVRPGGGILGVGTRDVTVPRIFKMKRDISTSAILGHLLYEGGTRGTRTEHECERYH